MKKIRPNILLLGSSRTEIGINPDNIAEKIAPKTIYNGALSGATMVHIESMVHHTLASAVPERIILGTDFFMFNEHNNYPFTYPQLLKATPQGENSFYQLQRYVLSLFSADITSASFSTLRDQKDGITRISPSGFHNYNHRTEKLRKREGLYQVFLKSEFLYAEDSWTPCANNSVNWEFGIEKLRSLLRDTQRKDVEVTLFISPAHARLWLAMEHSGLWPEYEAWKRALTSLASEFENVQLWDFSQFNDFTQEALPPLGDKQSSMRWYYDVSHYHQDLGNLVLEHLVLGKSQGINFEIANQLNNANIDAHLKGLREDLDKFKNQSLQNEEEIRGNLDKALEVRMKSGTVCKN